MNSSQIEESLATSDEGVKAILSTILNMNMWNETNEKVIISALNKLLVVSKTRLQGLEFLNLVIDNCSARIISENGITWISHCLVKHPGDGLKELKLTTIGKIINNSHEEQEFNKKFISEYISKVFEVCLTPHSNLYECEAALDTLTICMKYYGSWFAPYKLRIENFVTNFFDSPSKEIVEKAAIAFHYLQQIGGAGTDGINHKKNFSANFEKVCATVQKLLDTFFENEVEIDQSDRSNLETFEFTNLALHTQKMLHITARRIKNCLAFLKTMLKKRFSTEKEIKPISILNLISRGTAIHRCMSTDRENSLDDFQFSILLNQIQIELLQLLDVLIVWLHGNALPFTFIITKILIDCLNKSQTCQCFKADSFYQETVYKVLGCWIRVSRGAVHTHFQTQLIKSILKDIMPVENKVSLNLASDTIKNKSKKAVQKAVRDKIISSGLGNTTEELTNLQRINKENNCSFALDTLKNLLVGTMLKLPPNIIQELYRSIVGTLMDIQVSKTCHPYTNPNCEAKLYEVLVSFYEQDTLKVLPPLQLIIDVLNRGINNSNKTIALTCEHGLSVLEKICQPLCPSMFVPEVITMKEVVKETALVEAEFEEEGNVNKTFTDEVNSDALSVLENRESVLEIPENDTEVTENRNGSLTLEQQPSVHIIDVQIIKTCLSGVELDESIVEEFTATNGNESTSTVVVERLEENEVKNNRNIQLINGSESVIEEETETLNKRNNIEVTEIVVEKEEPPLKKLRIEETEINIKEEQLAQTMEDYIFEEESKENAEPLENENKADDGLNDSTKLKYDCMPQNEEDDIFVEGDDFVDAVKDY